MINGPMFKRLIRLLIDGTDKDKIIWENDMLNIHETFFHGDRIVIDILQDDPPTFIIGHSALQLRGVGIEELTQHINEQYKRLKKGRHSDAAEIARVVIEAKAQEEELKNDHAFNVKTIKLLMSEGAICQECTTELSERTQKIAAALGCKAVLCEKCNPHNSKLTESDMERIRSILLGKSKTK